MCLETVLDHVLCMESNCFVTHESSVYFATKKEYKYAVLKLRETKRERASETKRRNDENAKKQQKTIYYLLHRCIYFFDTPWWLDFTMFIVRVVSFFVGNVSAWVCVQKHLTLPLITSEKRANSKLFKLFTWKLFKYKHSLISMECCLKIVPQSTDRFIRCDLSSM